MGRVKMIYATILAVIYVTASLMSSLSVLSCDHPHHTHHEAEQTECCCHHHNSGYVAHHNAEAFNAECCDHDHELLGDNHTQYIVDNERSNSALSLSYLLLANVAIVDIAENHTTLLAATKYTYRGDESSPLCAAFSRYDSLRAPPVVA